MRSLLGPLLIDHYAIHGQHGGISLEVCNISAETVRELQLELLSLTYYGREKGFLEVLRAPKLLISLEKLEARERSPRVWLVRTKGPSTIVHVPSQESSEAIEMAAGSNWRITMIVRTGAVQYQEVIYVQCEADSTLSLKVW
jgi:hypothetical protein